MTGPIDLMVEEARERLNTGEAMILVYAEPNAEALMDIPSFVYAVTDDTAACQAIHDDAKKAGMKLESVIAITAHGLHKLTNISRHGKANWELRSFLEFCQTKP